MKQKAFSDVPVDINYEVVEIIKNLKMHKFLGYEIKP
jgi:hypothetical protein